MAYTPLKISIPEPCHEDWSGMHPVPGATARHCDSCAKNVVDFTGFSDAKMHAYVREQGGKLCGRFRPDQLDRPLRAVSAPTSNPLKVAAAAAGVLLAATGCETPNAVTGTPTEEETWEIFTDGLVLDIPTTGGISLAEVEHPPKALPVIEMTTVEKNGPPPPPPLAGEISAEFMLPPPAYEDPDTLRGKPVLTTFEEQMITTCGIKEVVPETIEGEIEVFEEDFLMGDIDLSDPIDLPHIDPVEEDPIPPPWEEITSEQIRNLPTRDIGPHQGVFMGMVAIEQPRPTGIDWIKDTLKNVLPPLPALPSHDPTLHQRPRPEMLLHLEALTVFPNPFVGHLKVVVNLPAKETLTVELLDPNGRLIFARVWNAEAGENTLTIEPKQRELKHAIYYLRVTDRREFSVTKTVVR